MDKKIVINLYFWSALSVLTGQIYAIAIARNISVDDFGTYTLLTQIMLFILPLNTLGIQRVLRIKSSKGEGPTRKLVKLGLNFTFITSLLAIPIWSYLYFTYTDLGYQNWLIILLASFCISIWSVVTVVFELEDKWIQRQRVLFYYSLLNVLILFLVIELGIVSASARLVTVGFTSLILGALIIVKFKLVDSTTLTINNYMAPDLKVGTALALVSMSDNLFLIIDKTLIINRLGDFANGILSAHLILFSLVVLAYAPISTYLENIVFRNNTKLGYGYLIIVILIISSIGVYYLAPVVFTFLYGTKFIFTGSLLLKVYFLALLKIARDIVRIFLSKRTGILHSAVVNIIALIALTYMYFESIEGFINNVVLIYLIIFFIDFIILYGKRNHSSV